MFWASDGSSRSAKVPISASVATIPRTVSSANVSRSSAPSGASVRASHSSSSATSLSHVVGRPQRLQHGGPQPLRHLRHATVEPLPGNEVRVITQSRDERGAGRLGVLGVDEQAAGGVVREEACTTHTGAGPAGRRGRGPRPPAVGAARRGTSTARAAPRRRGNGAAETAAPPTWSSSLEDENAPPGAREVGGRRQAVVAGTDDDVVVGRNAHRPILPGARDRPPGASLGAWPFVVQEWCSAGEGHVDLQLVAAVRRVRHRRARQRATLGGSGHKRALATSELTVFTQSLRRLLWHTTCPASGPVDGRRPPTRLEPWRSCDSRWPRSTRWSATSPGTPG